MGVVCESRNRRPTCSGGEEMKGKRSKVPDGDHAPSEAVERPADLPDTKKKAKKAVKRPLKSKTPKPAKKKKSDESKPLSTEELIQLKETEQLYHTNLLRMQIEELLKEVKLKDKRRKSIDDFLQKISGLIEKIPRTSQTDIADQSWLPKSVKVPFLQIPFQVKGSFHFLPPSSIKVVGSYLLGTCIKPEINVDVSVTMPQEILEAKDHLNQRYLRKRALYLAYIAARLAPSKIFSSVKFAYMNSNHLKPMLLLRPEGEDGKMVTVRIHVCLPPGMFKCSRFFPGMNNVRTTWYLGDKNVPEEGASLPATPHYNNAVLCDLAMEQHFHHLSSCVSDFPSMKDGISILKVWLRQRQLDKGYGSFNGFVVSMLVAYLLSRKKINKVMNGHQVLRNTLQFLASTDLTTNGITMSTSADSSSPSVADFHQAFEVVFVDPLGLVNLCAEMTAAKYKQIQFEAKESLRVLEDTNTTGFLQVLMVPKPFVRSFDHVFHVTQVAKLQKTCQKMKLLNELVDRGGDYVAATLPFILSVLEKGLDQRVVLVSHAPMQKPEWDIREEPAQHKDISALTVGLMLTADFFSSVLEKGPAADNPEAAEFKSFWGEKSELRRFQDASICEAVVWPASSVEEKRSIPELIIRHLLQLHADLPGAAICFAGNLLDCVLAKQKKAGTGEEQMVSVIQSYDDLSRKLWSLEDLPLTVTAVQGTHPALRYTDVFPPVPANPEWNYYNTTANKMFLIPSVDKPCPAYISPMKVICHMEGSGKWPQDKEAIKRVKAAFQLRLAELLKVQHKLLCKPSTTYTDVYKDGYVFRLQVAYHREPQSIKEFVTPEGMVKSRDTEESLQLELETIHLPHLTSTLHGLHQQLPAFGGTSRLAKRWISAQLLADSVSEECVDLLVAYLFLHPVPFTAPSSPQVGFLRFLNLLASYDWKSSPLIVNFNGDLTDADFSEIQNDFTATRDKLPVMFIATPKDRKMSVWTKKKPTAQILQRLIILTSESLTTVEKQLMQPSESSDIKMIFRPPLDLYDVLIHLNPKHIPRHREAVDQPTKSFVRGLLKADTSCINSRFPVVDYDPPQLYLNELRESFGEFALFFYDAHGGEVIGVIWNPSSFAPKPFRMTKVNGRLMEKKGNSVLMIPNVEAILEDFKILGEGLVKSIECQSERWNI
ncbi:nucleolar protein 6 isoform X2 [Phyllobates terribilis]|uniref:nucleolar protein 6 isoform X2 n=1 Tax=Phyllobates terribilis TaxID=111132 RepID=UPI003CCA77E4